MIIGLISLNRHVIGYEFDYRVYKCEQWIFQITTELVFYSIRRIWNRKKCANGKENRD